MPWHTFGALPSNASNRRRYRGVNVLGSVGGSRTARLYDSALGDLSAMAGTGRASAERREVAPPSCSGSSTAKIRKRRRTTATRTARSCHGSDALLGHINVFNADQVDGFSIPEMPALPEAQRIEQAEDFFRQTGIRIIETGVRAFYDPQSDEIHMPPFSLFKKADYFYSTLAHEVSTRPAALALQSAAREPLRIRALRS